jgi:hypothetical protein
MDDFRNTKTRSERPFRKRRGDLDQRVTFRHDAAHLEELEEYGKAEGMSNSFLVRHLVIRFLESKRKTQEVFLPRLQL